MSEKRAGMPEAPFVRHPDVLVMLDSFDATFLPQLRRFSNILPGQPRLSEDALHAKYAAFSRAALSAFVGLPHMQAEVDASNKGEVQKATENERIQIRKRPIADSYFRRIDYAEAAYAEVEYKKFKVSVTPAYPEEELVTITYHNPATNYMRKLILEMREGEHKLTAHTAGNNTVGTVATAVFKETKGTITAATVDVKAVEGTI